MDNTNTIKVISLNFNSGVKDGNPWTFVNAKLEYQGKIYMGPVWEEKSSRGTPLKVVVAQ